MIRAFIQPLQGFFQIWLNENERSIKKAQKAQKQVIDYNPDKFIEPDRADYEWEKNESSIRRIVIEEINKFLVKK